MTNFINLTNSPKPSSKVTVFKDYLNGDLEASESHIEPNEYLNVAFIGHDGEYGDVFKCWDDDENDFTLMFGTKGDEFNS